MVRSIRNGWRLAFAPVLFFPFTFTAFAQQAPGLVASFSGTLSNPSQEDRITFELDASQMQLNVRGGVDLTFVMSSVLSAASPVDPGLITIHSKGNGSVRQTMRRPDTANSTASIVLATLTPGRYEIAVRGEHKTTGPYRLDVLLAGDANGDFKVDTSDVALIAQLEGTKKSEANYSQIADVDRNGVINGGDQQRVIANLGAQFVPPASNNPLEQTLPAGALVLMGAAPDTYVSRTDGLRFSLAGAEFDATLADITLNINGAAVPAGSLVIEPQLLTANVTLADGRNDVSLQAYDTVGRPLYYKATLWAGSATLQVNLVNPNGTAFTEQANVIASLSDDPAVGAEGVTTTGSITFTNIPTRTILIKAKGIGNQFGTAGFIGTQGIVTINMVGFKPPSAIDNNNLSLGASGWEIVPGSPVSIIPHTEIISGFPSGTSALFTTKAAIVDQDIMVGTSGLGERSLSRTFTTSAGTTAVKVRYRFITSGL